MGAPVLVMGVAGSGKTSLGQAVAAALGYRFLDADDAHTSAARAKMAAGNALTEEDRRPWLTALNAALAGESRTVLACSALRQAHRDQLALDLPAPLRVVFLDATPALIAARLATRQGHFFPASLAASQFALLEPPAACLRLNPANHLSALCAQVLAWLNP
jgi:gluconokinase